jgi:hypothetical protein
LIRLAIARARWLSSDQDRARFHDPYVFRVTGVTADYVVVEQIEVITEFRRLELLGEQHARWNDNFGRAGLRDAEEALRPWRGRVAIVVQLLFRPTTRYITSVPLLDIVMGEHDSLLPIETHANGINNSDDFGSTLIGGAVEAVFDAKSIAQASRPVVRWNGTELVNWPIDFDRLE